MKIIVGHANMDLDCLGSMVLARCLFPDHQPVRSRLIHPAARNLYNLYRNTLGLLQPEELGGQSVERVVVVDTRSLGRIGDLLPCFDLARAQVLVFDHHGEDPCDIPGAVVREKAVGANTTLLGLELLRRGATISAEDATVALTGIYADTGNFTHENVACADFQVASFCLQCGASLQVVNTFLRPRRDAGQLALFHELLARLGRRSINGHLVLLASLTLDRKVPGLAALAERVFAVEHPDALFLLFSFRRERQHLIIARSASRELDVACALHPFGGAGHAMAASALLRGEEGDGLAERLEARLQESLRAAATAREIMTANPRTVAESDSLLAAALVLEQADHTGAPVTDAAGRLVGFLTLRDIMKGRRAGAMKAPVRAYMSRKVIAAAPDTPVREVEGLLFANNVGHLPVVEGERLVGLVTRGDYLRFVSARGGQDREFLAALDRKVQGAPGHRGEAALESG